MKKLKTKRFKNLEIKTKKILSGDFFGNYKTLFKGHGIDFAEIREYIFGDSIKRIDWKTTAKHNKTFVKNYEQQRDLKIMFFLDNSYFMNFGTENISKKDLLAQIFYILGLSALKAGDNVGVIIFDEKNDFLFDYSKSEEIIIKAINYLYSNNSCYQKTKNNLKYINFLKKYKLKDNLIFILTDNLEFDKKIFRSLDLYNEIIYINIFDFFENNLSKDNLNFSFGNSKNFKIFSFSNNDLRKKYIKLRLEKLQNFKKNCEKNNIKYINIDTKSDLLKKLTKQL